jgi:hypothetical protein
MSKTRHWDCPDTGAKLDFEAVLARLRTQAAELEIRMNHEVRLSVVGIDLTRTELIRICTSWTDRGYCPRSHSFFSSR